VTFDPNYRPALWESPPAAGEAMREVLPFVDWVLCGLEEGCAIFEVPSQAALRRAVLDAGAQNLAVRIGERGAIVWAGDEQLPVPPRRLERVIDEIGAGDGFAAGFAFGLLNGLAAPGCARAGNVVAAHALRGTGDWETFPHLADVVDELFEEP
jgi:sugar/nucleoside kinase (ribokinase family)